MKQMPRAAVVATAALLLSGCGTVCNFAGGLTHADPQVYGGVQLDLAVLGAIAGVSTVSDSAPVDPRVGFIFLGILLVDPILSLAGDTLTLPITLYIEHQRKKACATDHSQVATESSPRGEGWNSAIPCKAMVELVDKCTDAAPAVSPQAVQSSTLPPILRDNPFENCLIRLIMPALPPVEARTNDAPADRSADEEPARLQLGH